MFKTLILIFGSAALVGCNSANSRVSSVAFGETKGIVTSGNLRMVTERKKYGYPAVVCTEPSPDYMVAFGSKRTLTGNSPTAAGTRSVEVNVETTEAVSEGEGREAAVLALRDGLYTACQNYANGVIGQDAYSIILSQYGNLLVALVGNDAAAAKIEVSGPQAALSAMTVGCISSYDTTRSRHNSNQLLSATFCAELLRGVAKRALAQSVAAAKPTVKKTPPKPTPPVTPTGGSSVTTTTTTNTVAK